MAVRSTISNSFGRSRCPSQSSWRKGINQEQSAVLHGGRSASAVGVGTAFGIGRRDKIAGNHFGQLLIGAGLLVETESFPYLGSAKRIAL